MKKSIYFLALTAMSISYTNIEAQVSADSAIIKLKEGNERFIKGKTLHPNQDFKRIKEVASGQKPFAIIVGCSDSRVPNEIIFDQGIGDLFIT
jgi:carbonic anhydrase